MMQENNNFETIISSWRRMSADQAESVTVSMSGDSPDYLHKKKDEESSLLVPEKIKGPIATAASAGVATTIVEVPSNLTLTDPEEKHLIDEKEHDKEAAGDFHSKEDEDYLENKDVANKVPATKQEKSSDKVDSVYVNQPSTIKPPLSNTTANPEEDECIIKCLYYTLQCCDCVLM